MAVNGVIALLLTVCSFNVMGRSLEIRFKASKPYKQTTYNTTVIPIGSIVTLICKCENCTTIHFLNRQHFYGMCEWNKFKKRYEWYGKLENVEFNECEGHSGRITFAIASHHNTTRLECRGATPDYKMKFSQQVQFIIISMNDSLTSTEDPPNATSNDDNITSTDDPIIQILDDAGGDKGSWMQYMVGGGVAGLIITTLLVYLLYRLKRKWRNSDSAGIYIEAVASPIVEDRDSTEFDEGTAENSGQQDQESLAAVASPRNPQPSERLQRVVQRRSDEWSVRTDSYLLPNYCEINEGLMNSPKPLQVPYAPSPGLKNSPSSAEADVRALRDQSLEGTNTGVDINITLVAECFRNNETDNIPDAENYQPQPDHYEHLSRDQYMTFSNLKKKT